MKIGQSSSFQKLISGKVETQEKPRNEETKKSELRERSASQGLQGSVESNQEAASTLRAVEKETQGGSRAEVQRELNEASKSSVEDVEKLADLVSDEIRDNPSKAIEAQANQQTSKVGELLR